MKFLNPCTKILLFCSTRLAFCDYIVKNHMLCKNFSSMPRLRVVQIRWDISDVEFKSYTILPLKTRP